MALLSTTHSVNQILYFGTATASPVSEGTGFSMNTSTQFADDTSWGDSFQTQKPGIIQATCTLNKHYDHAELELTDAAQNRTPGSFYFYPDRDETGDYISWTGYVSGGGPQAGGLNQIISQAFDVVFSTQPVWTRSA